MGLPLMWIGWPVTIPALVAATSVATAVTLVALVLWLHRHRRAGRATGSGAGPGTVDGRAGVGAPNRVTP